MTANIPEILKGISPQEYEAVRRDAIRLLSEKSLYKFVKWMWPVIEPYRPFVEGWAIGAICEHLQAVTDGQIRRLILNVPPGFSKSLCTSVFWPAWEWGPKKLPSMRYICASYSQDLTVRDNIRCRNLVLSPLYQGYWGKGFKPADDQFTKVKFANDKTGWKLATSVSGIGTGERADRFLMDDPNSVQEAESEAVTASTNQWALEVVPTRLNDPERSAIILIQQRTNENDVTGTYLAKDLGYEHCMIPMHYDETRHCVTSIGWEDPRDTDGELAWPERFPEHVVDELMSVLGPYACTPAESPVLMGDLSQKPISQIVAGDEVAGFTTDTESASKRRHLVRTRVKQVFTYQAQVVKVTLDSGEVIRCTPDHKWYMGKEGGQRGWKADGTADFRPLYRPAIVGRKLMRVCPPRLPELTPSQKLDAAWLAGFFDGEGTASNLESKGRLRHDGTKYRPSCVISFAQTSEKNLPICDKLENVLQRLGYDYTLYQRKNLPANRQASRLYALRGQNLPFYQKFLHTVQPTKWRERIADGAFGAKFITGQEAVVSIEPDGIETVYALETETGNYVVWGLASSNSAGQLEQSPVPRGGGIIKREWWQHYEGAVDINGKETYPICEFVVASLDTAYGEKEENDYSALTVWGLWYKDGVPKLLLLNAWKKRLPLNGSGDMKDRQNWGLVEWVAHSCKRFSVDRLIIENKARGVDVGNEIRRLYRDSLFGVELVDPKGKDKVARTHAVVPMFTDGMVYAPDRGWAEEVIGEVSVFPKGSHDDLHDSVIYALSWFRRNNLAQLRAERAFEEESLKQYRPKAGPLYPV